MNPKIAQGKLTKKSDVDQRNLCNFPRCSAENGALHLFKWIRPLRHRMRRSFAGSKHKMLAVPLSEVFVGNGGQSWKK